MQENNSLWHLDKLMQLSAAALALSTAVAESWMWLENYIRTSDSANGLPLHAAVTWSKLPRGCFVNCFVRSNNRAPKVMLICKRLHYR